MNDYPGRQFFAFPFDHRPIKNGDESADRQAGMTLRDYFAAKAMQGMFASESADSYCPEKYLPNRAKFAYIMADAMLAERAK